MNCLQSKLWLTGTLVALLASAAPASAHETGNWVNGDFKSCFDACGGSPIVSGEYALNTLPHAPRRQHYFVCRVKTSVGGARAGRPGFNISTRSTRCQISGFNSVQHYDCLCQ